MQTAPLYESLGSGFRDGSSGSLLVHLSLFIPFLSVWPDPDCGGAQAELFLVWGDLGVKTSSNRLCCRAVGTTVGCNTVADLLLARVPLSSCTDTSVQLRLCKERFCLAYSKRFTPRGHVSLHRNKLPPVLELSNSVQDTTFHGAVSH